MRFCDSFHRRQVFFDRLGMLSRVRASTSHKDEVLRFPTALVKHSVNIWRRPFSVVNLRQHFQSPKCLI